MPNTYCFSTVTMVRRTRRNVTLHVHWLSCFLLHTQHFIFPASLYLCSPTKEIDLFQNTEEYTIRQEDWYLTKLLVLTDESFNSATMSPPGQQGKAVWWTTISCSHSYFPFTEVKLVEWAIWFRKLDVGVCLRTQLAVLAPGDQERNRNTESVKSSSSTNTFQNQTPLQQAKKSICTVIAVEMNRQCETESSLCTRTKDLIFHHYPVSPILCNSNCRY
jgi:hypothetical protein